MTRKSLLLTLSLVLAVAFCGFGAYAADDASQAEAHAAVARGVKWLTQMQKENGAWSRDSYPALTGLALWALVGSGMEEAAPAAERAIAFLKLNVQDDGGIYKEIPGVRGGGLSNYNTAICMMALHATGRPELAPIVLKARTFVAGNQHLGDDVYKGGFGYDKDTKRAYTDLMNTHFTMETMRRTQSVEDLRPAGEPKADINWDAALKFVESLQNTEEGGKDQKGGFIYHPNDPKAGTVTNAAGKVFLRAYGSMTYAGLLALVYADVPPTDPRVISAVNWTGEHWTLEENPGMGAQGLFFFYNVMSRALTASGRDTIPRDGGKPVVWKQELTRKILSMQQKDGSWVNDTGRFWENDPVLASSYALIALQLASGMAK